MAPPPRGPSSPTKAAPPAAAPAPPSSQEKEVAFLRAQLDVLRAQGAREAQEHSAQLRDVTAKLADAEAVLSHSKRLEVDQKTIITALEAKLAELSSALSARDAEVARLNGDAAAARATAAERDRLVEERALLDTVGRQQGALLSRQTADLGRLTSRVATLEQQLAASRGQVDALRIQSWSSTHLQALFGRPCLVARHYHKLTGTPPADVAHAACCALGEAWLVLHTWMETAPVGAPPVTYALHVPTHTWHKLPHHDSAARQRAALVGIGACDPSCEAAAAVLLIGGSAAAAAGGDPSSPGNARADVFPDAAVLLVSDDAASTPDGLDDVLGGPALKPHWAPPTAAHGLCARTGASACAGPDGTLFLVGGRDASGNACDCASVGEGAASNPHAVAWQPAHGTPSQLGPSPRCRASVAVQPDGARMWLFGGVDEAGAAGASHPRRRLGDLFSYDTKRSQWTCHEPAAGPLPCGRDGAALCALSSDCVLLAGGCVDDAGVPVHDVWALDVPSMTWQCLIPGPNPSEDAATGPCGACGAVACFTPSGVLHMLHTRTDAADVAVWDVLETVRFTLPDDVDDIVTSSTADAAAADATHVGASTTLRLWLHAAGSTSLELRWRPIARNADRITGYTLMMTPGGSTLSTACYRGLGEWATVAGLKTGWEYVFSLKCSYDDGSHVWSDTVAFRTRRGAGAAAQAHPGGAAARPRGGAVLQKGDATTV